MKKIFYPFLLLFVNAAMVAQTPGGVAGSVLWLKANSGASPAAWTDNSGSGNNFSQVTGGNQPVLTTNVFNHNAALQFNGTSAFMVQPAPTGFPTANSDRTILVVANVTTGQTAGYRWIFVYGNVGFGGGTCQVGNNTGNLANDFYGADFEYPNYWNAAPNLNSALASFTLNGGTGTQYDRGNFLQTTAFPNLSAPSANAVIGALDGTPLELWSGSIGEIIMFNSSLSAADRNKVEAYLALKYGFTLGTTASPISYVASDGTTTYWTGSATYQNDVFGIGTDNGTAFTQTQSNSMNSGSGNGTGQSAKGNIVLSAGAALADNQFLVIGNNAGVLTEQTILAGEAPAIAVGSQRVVRNWKVQNTGTVGAVDLSFDVTGLTFTGGATLANYRLMIDQDGDGDYNTGTPSFIIPSSFTGNLLAFSGVTLNNNVVFTIITQRSALLPAVWEGFNVSLQKNKATLTWKTSSEVNVDHYTVEYSLNGVTYLTAGTVTAKNGTGLNTYSLEQENLPAGIRYYRIKRVDKDGQFQLSEIKTVRAGGLTTVALKANPILKGRLDMIIDVPQSQVAVIRVVSTSGKVIVQQNTGLSTGSNNVSTNISRVAPGSYFLQVQLADEVINKKFVRL